MTHTKSNNKNKSKTMAAQNTDLSPVEYLEKRIRYYKKKLGNARNWPKDEFFIKRYGLRKIKKYSVSAIKRIEGRIIEYKGAISKLNQQP